MPPELRTWAGATFYTSGQAAKLHQPDDRPPISDKRAAELCGEWSRLEEGRLALNRQAAALKKQTDAIEAELLDYVQKTTKPKKPVRDLKRWLIQIVEVARSIYYTGALVEAIGQEEIDRRNAALGTQPRIEITDKQPPAAGGAIKSRRAA
jgi:hypothetical protein